MSENLSKSESTHKSTCLFCKIINKQIKADIVYEDENFLAFKDIHPKAPVHVLIIPKQHFDSLAHLSHQEIILMGELTIKLQEIALSQGLNNGFRTMINTGPGGGQEVNHIHYHLLGTSTA